MTAKGMPQTEESDRARRPGEQDPPPRILLVDDEPGIRQLGAAVLIHSGYQVDDAADGAAAWQALTTDNYDLLITDNNMPKVTGIELLKKLRAARMELPVILVTGAPPVEELRQHPWLQIDATLLKPFTVEALLGTVTQVLRATVNTSEQIGPPPDWQSPPAAERARLY
jgi:DNA-binding response OmpR family regulator